MSLPQLIQHVIDEQGVSIRTIAERGGLSHPTVSKWMKATRTDTIEDATIDGLAKGLQVDRDVVYRAALGIPAPTPFDLPARASRLSDSERRVVVGVVDAILTAHARGSDQQVSEAPAALPRAAKRQRRETEDPSIGG